MNNPLAHELTTAPEIIDAVTSTPSKPARPSSGKVDVFVAGAGTGGTVTGVSRGIKKVHNPKCIIIATDPASKPPQLLAFLSDEMEKKTKPKTLERKHPRLPR